ncbi:MAG: MBL fold metallo-hydrolase, partial [bacterium]
MQVIHFPLSTNYVNSFLCFNADTKEAFLVDCGAFTDEIKNFIQENKLKLQFLLITHAHYDHVDGVVSFKKSFKVPIYSASKNYDHQISGGDTIPFGNADISVIATPGHTSDSVSFYLEHSVFVGDA